MICMPERRRFTGTEIATPAKGFYSTPCHELVHWSGAKHRLPRDLTGRFGTESCAMEELVAELGAAFPCGDLGITPEPRADHAQVSGRSGGVLRIGQQSRENEFDSRCVSGDSRRAAIRRPRAP